jgi:flagellar biosynthetic protein FliR
VTIDLPALFAPRSLAVLALVSVRMSALVLIAPFFSTRAVPVSVRTTLILALTLLLHPIALARATATVELTLDTLITEALVGFAIGLGAAVFVGAAEMAGDLIAIQSGLSGAAVLDPMTSISMPVVGQFMQLLTLALLLAANAHLVMLDAVAVSLREFPVGSLVNARAGFAAMLSAGSTLFGLGIRFAAPVLAAILVANVALAILSRAAPQLNVLSIAFPLQIGLGLFVLAAALPFMVSGFVHWSADYDALLTRFLGALAAGGH